MDTKDSVLKDYVLLMESVSLKRKTWDKHNVVIEIPNLSF